MSERFTLRRSLYEFTGIKDEETHCFYEIHDSAQNVNILCERLNKLSTENRQLKEECDALQKKTEIDKNDFFISEAKRMRLLAFIEDNGLRKEYSEWERRIWNE